MMMEKKQALLFTTGYRYDITCKDQKQNMNSVRKSCEQF